MDERVRAWLGLAAVAGIAAAAVVYLRTGPEGAPRRDPGPIASPSASQGTVGGLLPDVSLRGRYGATPARQLRPAVILLARPECACVEIVRQVVADATPAGVVTYVVEAAATPRGALSLAAQAGGDAGGFADPEGVLAATYRLRSDAALVLVRRDGVVTQVVAGVAPSLRLDSALRALVA